VNRKVWGGNRTDAGGEAQAVISSVLQTCANSAPMPSSATHSAASSCPSSPSPTTR
jgi:hypothetical protein